MNMTQNGVTTTIDLSDGREVFGNATTATGNVRTVQMGGSGGFKGSYSAPESLLPTNKTTEVEVDDLDTSITASSTNSTSRRKQTSTVVEEET